MHWWPNQMGTGGWFMFLFWVVVIIAVVWGITYFIKEQVPGKKEKEDPYQIARVRYARGEISKEELEEIVSNLNSENKRQ